MPAASTEVLDVSNGIRMSVESSKHTLLRLALQDLKVVGKNVDSFLELAQAKICDVIFIVNPNWLGVFDIDAIILNLIELVFDEIPDVAEEVKHVPALVNELSRTVKL